MTLEGYRTISEMAKALGKHPQTLARWRQLRRGPPWIKLGQTVLYPDDGLKQHLRDLERDATQAA